MIKLLAFVALAAAAAGAAHAQSPAPSPAPAPASKEPSRGGAAAQVRAILDEHVEYLKRNDPLAAGRRGDERFNDQLADEGVAAHEARLAELAARLKRLEALDLAALADPERTDAELLKYDLSIHLAGARFHREQMPVSTMSGPQIWLPQMAQQVPLQKEKHYADFAARLEKMPRLIEQSIEQMRAGLKAGRVPPKVTMGAAVDQCLAQATPNFEKDPALSPFYRPFLSRPSGDPVAARARAAIATGIVPAYRSLAAFLKDEYIPRCRDTIGISDGLDGAPAYDHALRSNTTLDLKADEVHTLGRSEVARIQGEMAEVIARTEFPRKTELKGEELIKAFNEWLRHEPRFYYKTPGELLDGYRAIAKEIDPELAKLFRVLPRNPYGVREMPAFSAPSSPTAYYYGGSLKGGVPGYFIANTYKLDQRPKYSMIPLTLHEAVPGHHLQLALADELEGQHEYHQWVGFTAFVEGWGLYAERLGLEMKYSEPRPPSPESAADNPSRGLYANPYDDFGRLSFEMWRACRLVVDTGMHAKGWKRQQAIDFILANTGLAPFDAEREVDRYIAWPGQACAYKIGELKLRELRKLAETRLGTAFDIRAFHDAVLGAGAVPLPVLESRVKRWIESAAPTPR